MWGEAIFCLVFLVAGILIAVYARWTVKLLYDINKDIVEGLGSSRIPHLTDILVPKFQKGKWFVLYARIFGIAVAIVAAFGLYAIIYNQFTK